MNTFIIASISADGFISPSGAESDAPSTTWTSREDSHFFQQKTKEAGVVIMGRKTYDTIPKNHQPLKDRLNIIYTRSKPSSDGGQSLDSSEVIKEFDISKPNYTQLPPSELVLVLESLGHNSIAICGGSSLYTQFLKAGVIDEIFLSIEPIIFGAGTPLFDKQLQTKLNLIEVISLSDQTKVLHYKIN